MKNGQQQSSVHLKKSLLMIIMLSFPQCVQTLIFFFFLSNYLGLAPQYFYLRMRVSIYLLDKSNKPYNNFKIHVTIDFINWV